MYFPRSLNFSPLSYPPSTSSRSAKRASSLAIRTAPRPLRELAFKTFSHHATTDSLDEALEQVGQLSTYSGPCGQRVKQHISMDIVRLYYKEFFGNSLHNTQEDEVQHTQLINLVYTLYPKHFTHIKASLNEHNMRHNIRNMGEKIVEAKKASNPTSQDLKNAIKAFNKDLLPALASIEVVLEELDDFNSMILLFGLFKEIFVFKGLSTFEVLEGQKESSYHRFQELLGQKAIAFRHAIGAQLNHFFSEKREDGNAHFWAKILHCLQPEKVAYILYLNFFYNFNFSLEKSKAGEEAIDSFKKLDDLLGSCKRHCGIQSLHFDQITNHEMIKNAQNQNRSIDLFLEWIEKCQNPILTDTFNRLSSALEFYRLMSHDFNGALKLLERKNRDSMAQARIKEICKPLDTIGGQLPLLDYSQRC